MANVLVTIRANHDKNGKVGFEGARHVIQGIRRRYADGRVQTTSGDVWMVKEYGKKFDGQDVEFIVDEKAESRHCESH